MSTLRVNNLQIGQSGTAAQNFTLYQPTTPDGTLRLAVGNSGATTGDVLSVSSTGLSVTGTLSATGNVTLSGGTANGVLYLNGSKVATSGTALAFNGTNLTLGTAGALLQMARLTDGSVTGSVGSRTSGNFSLYNSGGSSTEITVAASDIRFDIGASEQMRLTSTGLGIGTSSPSNYSSAAYNLVIAGTGQRGMTISSTDSNQCSIFFANSTVGAAQYAGYLAYFHSNNSLAFATNSTERMRLDSSGNLGIGTSSPDVKLVVKAGNGNQLVLDNAGETYTQMGFKTGGTARGTIWASATDFSLYTYSTQPIIFWTNATERMRLDSSGNLGLGTSSPQNRLDLGGPSSGRGITWENYANVFSEYSSGALYLSSNYYGNIGSSGFKTSSTASFGAAGISVSGTSGSGNGGLIQFFVDPATSKTAGNAFTPTERARITSGGYFKASYNGSYIGSTNNYHELVGGAGGDWMLRARNTAGTAPYGIFIDYNSASPNGTASEFIYCQDSGPTLRMSVRSNGGIANYSANNVNLSDRREKTNFAPAGEYLSKICAIPVQTFNYIDQNLEEDPGLTLGVVAQDVQAVAPELVMESNWGTKDEPKMRLSIYQTDLQYALMKAIQEQQAIIETLTARVAALESK